jgi:hypothetical protein
MEPSQQKKMKKYPVIGGYEISVFLESTGFNGRKESRIITAALLKKD